MTREGAIAANRFGLGARPGEVDRGQPKPKNLASESVRWSSTAGPFMGLSTTAELVSALVQKQQARQQARQAKDRDALKQFLMQTREIFLKEMSARFANGFQTDEPFRERLVHAEWSGLKAQALRDGRDLPPRTDTRTVLKVVLADHLGIPKSVLDERIFPDSGSVKPPVGLIRA